MKHELLVPAGDMASLEQAIANGADAVYLGCQNFGARKFAANFTNEELITGVKLCHLYGVKMYVTMNTLVKDDEVPMFLGQIEFLHKIGVDAVLIQDFGMLCLVREKYPDLEVHASTQANTSAKETAELFHKLGVKRVVFSRELSLKEIEDIKVPIEKEVFIHGALCISYSGCCLMSSMQGSRSGNRGECTGCCRLPYSLKKEDRIIEENKYLLSTKELNTSKHFTELLDSSITSFKIEGRMKSPEYVGFITRYYRKLIDSYNQNPELEKETEELKTIFNRGFTDGRLFNCTDEELMNIDNPNHIGLEIGKVIEVTKDKIKIQVDKELNQEDGIRFLQSGKGLILNYLYDESGKLTNTKTEGGICYVDNKVELTEKDVVCKTLDHKLMTSLKVLPPRKIIVTFKVTAKLGKPLNMVISDGTNVLQVNGQVVQMATTAPITISRIREQVEKLGETPFVSTATIIDSDDGIFINIKEINELRRALTTNLMNFRMKVDSEIVINQVTLDNITPKMETGISVYGRTEDQISTADRLGAYRLYIDDLSTYKGYRFKDNTYYMLPRVLYEPTNSLERQTSVSDYFDYTDYDNIIGNYGLNVFNIYTAYYLYKMNVKVVTLSVELTEEEIINFINTYVKTFNTYPNIEVLAYGRVENMIIKGNILNLKENDMTYTLVDPKDNSFPVFYDGRLTHVLNYENKQLSNIDVIKKYATIRIDLFNEDSKTVLSIIKMYQ